MAQVFAIDGLLILNQHCPIPKGCWQNIANANNYYWLGACWVGGAC